MDTVTNSKVCSECKQKKDLSEFRLKPQQKLVYEPICKACQKEKMLNDPDYTNRNSDYLKPEKKESTHIADSVVDNSNFPAKTTPNKSTRKLRIP